MAVLYSARLVLKLDMAGFFQEHSANPNWVYDIVDQLWMTYHAHAVQASIVQQREGVAVVDGRLRLDRAAAGAGGAEEGAAAAGNGHAAGYGPAGLQRQQVAAA